MIDLNKEHNYYVFKYVIDSVSNEPTEHAGDIQSFVTATDPWNAVEKAGFSDLNTYGANRIDDLLTYKASIVTERKLLTRISKELKIMIDKQNEETKKVLTERLCPNGCGKMNKNFQCNKCGFGKE